MNRRRPICLLLIVCLLLTACQSRQAKEVQQRIADIGQVTQSSGDAIAGTREAYDSLPQEDKASVENYDTLLAAEAGYASILIDAIGEVTVDSGDTIAVAKTYLDAMPADSRVMVDNAALLSLAEEAYRQAQDEAKAEQLRRSLTGEWVHEVIGRDVLPRAMEDTDCEPARAWLWNEETGEESISGGWFVLMEDGTVTAEAKIGTWQLSEDLTQVVISGNKSETNTFEAIFTVLQEDGFVKLVGALPGSKPFGFVRQEEYSRAFDAKYVTVELTDGNFREYIGEPVSIGTAQTPDGAVMHTFVYPTKAYENGLVYLGCACSVTMTATIDGRFTQFENSFPVFCGWMNNITDFALGGRAQGQMYYVRADHVAENYAKEAGSRVLVLTNGTELIFNGYGPGYDDFWSRVDVSYSDYIY